MTIVRRSNNVFPTFFDEMFNKHFYGWEGGGEGHLTVPSVNVRNEEKGYDIEVAVPGLSKEDFNVQVDNNVLTVSSERKGEETSGDGKGYVRKEFSYSSFKRSFTLPEDEVDVEGISAKYENGILRIALPKKEVEKVERVRQVSIM